MFSETTIEFSQLSDCQAREFLRHRSGVVHFSFVLQDHADGVVSCLHIVNAVILLQVVDCAGHIGKMINGERHPYVVVDPAAHKLLADVGRGPASAVSYGITEMIAVGASGFAERNRDGRSVSEILLLFLGHLATSALQSGSNASRVVDPSSRKRRPLIPHRQQQDAAKH